jgi:hypothetical protein
MFRDNNDINEKSIIGFISFLVMVCFAVANIVMSYMGKTLIVNESIFNAFLILTISCFSISSVDKYITKNNHTDQNNERMID